MKGVFDFSRNMKKIIKELQHENRFFLSDECAKFVDNLINYAEKFKIHKLNVNKELYRARIRTFGMESKYYTLENMSAPPIHKATQGRINPVGIPYLYLANDIVTAVAEVRPWVGCDITVARFAINKEVSLINFSKKASLCKTDSKQINKTEDVWQYMMSYYFSMPFDPRDDTAYIPIQYISEKAKDKRFDGILYDSALNLAGYNVCLFNVNAAKANKLFTVSVKSIKYRNDINELATN